MTKHLLLLLALSLPAHAQVVSSSLLGQISDNAGAAVPNAKVVATNTATGLTRETVSSPQGAFSLPQLAPGKYRVEIQAAGFKAAEVRDIDLLVDQTRRIEVSLQVGELSQSIEVAGTAAALESETSSIGQVVEQRNIVGLPLNGRNFLQLATIAPGVAPAYNARSATITNQSGRPDLAVHISGNRGDSTSFLIDGVETRSTWFNSPSVILSVDAVQEFKIDRNMFSAEYGQGSGIVSLVSRSGSNDFHGAAYEFLRNSNLDAANFFDNYLRATKPPFRQNQYGITFGGPAIRNKLFFFGDWESLRSRKSNTLNALVPTPAMLSGDFTGQKAVIDPATGSPFPNNIIPASRISSVSRNFQKYMPAPNTTGSRNYVVAKSTVRDDNQGGGRVDYQISSADNVFGRFSDYQSSLYKPGTGILAGSVFPYEGQNAVLQHTHVFSPSLLNVFKIGFNHARVFNSWESTPTSVANEIGLHINQTPAEYGVPAVALSGGLYGGGGATINQGGLDHLWQFSNTLSYVRGKHNLKFGTDIRLLRFDLRLGLSNNGSFTFDGRYTGSPVGDFLLGNFSAATAQIGLGVGHFRSHSLNFFVADDYKITSRLTLNLGLRYEYDSPFGERDHKEGYFDTSKGAFVVGIASDQSPIKRDIPGIIFNPQLQPGIWSPDRNDFAPRIGLAYRISDKTVLRSGYGIFYTKTQGNELQFKINAPPLVFAASLTGNPTSPNYSWDRDAFPDPASPTFPVGTLSPFSVDPRDRTPYLQQWNFGVERQLASNLLLEVAYVASKGTKLAERVNINQAYLPSDPKNITPIASRRPFPGFGDILSANWQENSIYNALQARLERRYASGFSFLTSYTFGHSIDTASRGSGGSWHQNAHSLRQDRGNSDFDVRHRFVASGLYQLPFRTPGHPVLDRVVAGWSVNAILTLQTGNYFSVTVNGDRANVGGFPFQRANALCDGNLPRGERTIDRWYNVSCFTTTTPGTFGNSGRNIIEIPGLNNLDTALIKDTPIRESVSLQFRAEFFNFANHAQFNQPDMSIDNGAVTGQIRSARDGRISQLALKLIW